MERDTFIDQLVTDIHEARQRSDGLVSSGKPYLVVVPNDDSWAVREYGSLTQVVKNHPLLLPNIVASLGGQPIEPLYSGKAVLLDTRDLPIKEKTQAQYQ